tara:strand:- start:3149 stop:3283 length:135 start_codon:yes stop_codon:yes gene_type:complete
MVAEPPTLLKRRAEIFHQVTPPASVPEAITSRYHSNVPHIPQRE